MSVTTSTQIQHAYVVFFKERLGVAIAVDVDLGHSIEYCGVLAATLDTSLKPRKNQLQPVPLLHFMNKLINWEVARNRSQQSLDRCLVTIDVEKPANNLRSSHRVDSLNIYLDKFGETVLVKVKNEIVNKVEPIADNDEGKLVREFRLFEEVLDFLRVIEVTLSANTLDFPNLTCASGGLDILEMNLRILAKIDNRPEVIVEACLAL